VSRKSGAEMMIKTAEKMPERNGILPFFTLFKREIFRFWSVGVQTLVAPVITAALYLFVFGVGLGGKVDLFDGEIQFIQFVIPGLILMGVINNSFANSSSSLFMARYLGYIVDYLVMPLSSSQFILAFTLAAMIRGLAVGVVVWLVSLFFSPMAWGDPFVAISMAVIASVLFAQFGILAAIYSENFDHLSVFTNFVLMPMIFLGGVFYPISRLPGFWSEVSRLNPIFYLVDGFRYGTMGFHENPISINFAVAGSITVILGVWATVLIKKGYKIKT
jgi:ABC-2 type transport system permease protein